MVGSPTPAHAESLTGNDASRQQLVDFCESVTASELHWMLGGGWSVSGLLAHLAFYDRQVAATLRAWRAAHAARDDVAGLIRATATSWLPEDALAAWESAGVSLTDLSQLDINQLNARLMPSLLQTPPQAAAREAVEAAQTMDAEVAALEPELVRLVVESDKAWTLQPYLHREEHLTQIMDRLGR